MELVSQSLSADLNTWHSVANLTGISSDYRAVSQSSVDMCLRLGFVAAISSSHAIRNSITIQDFVMHIGSLLNILYCALCLYI